MCCTPPAATGDGSPVTGVADPQFPVVIVEDE